MDPFDTIDPTDPRGADDGRGATPDGGTRPGVPDEGTGGGGIGSGGSGGPGTGTPGTGTPTNPPRLPTDPTDDPTNGPSIPPVLPSDPTLPTINTDSYTVIVNSTPSGHSIYVDDIPSYQTTNASFVYTVNRTQTGFTRKVFEVRIANGFVTAPLFVEYTAITQPDGTGGRKIDVRNTGGAVVSSTTGSVVSLQFDVVESPPTPPPATNYTVFLSSNHNAITEFLLNGNRQSIDRNGRQFTFPANAVVLIEPLPFAGYTFDSVVGAYGIGASPTPPGPLPAAPSSLGGGINAKILTVTGEWAGVIAYTQNTSTPPPNIPTDPLPPTPTYTPVIVSAPSSGTFTIQDGQPNKTVQLPIQTLETISVRVTITGANFVREFTVNRRGDESRATPSSLVIPLNYQQEFSSKGYGLGNYTLSFTPIGPGLIEGETLYMPLRWVGVGLTPAITTVIYPNIVKIPQYVYNDKEFRIGWSSVNSDYVRLVSQYTDFGNLAAVGEVVMNYRDLVGRGAPYGPIQFSLIPYRNNVAGEPREVQIFFEQPAKLSRQQVVAEFVSKYDLLIDFDPVYNEIAEDYRWTRNLLNSGDDDNHLITTWIPDNITFDYVSGDPEKAGSVILKMYDPLPQSIEVNDQFWISFQETYPYIDSVILSDQALQDCIPLRPYDSDVEIEGMDGWAMGFETFNQLVGDSSTSATLINRYLSGSMNKELGIDYTNFEHFVHFSSAKERVTNFRYKLQLIESYNAKITNLDNSPATGSVAGIAERAQWIDLKNAMIGGFDGYDLHLYEGTGSTSWPKLSGVNYHSTASAATTWYASQSSEAIAFDNENQDYLVNNLPVHISNDSETEEYLLFVSMIGHHFDILWTYINALRQAKSVTNAGPGGIPDELVHHMLRSLGWKVKHGNSVRELWRYAFGFDNEGNVVDAIGGEDYTREVWRRILNNLPYLLKHKGTATAIKALITCYGIPASILSIREFGGPTPITEDNQQQSSFKFSDFTTALNFTGSSSVTIPWVDTREGHKPDAVEIRLRSTVDGNYNILQNTSGDWSLSYTSTTSSYDLGRVYLEVSGSPAGAITSSEMPIFNGEFFSVLINRTSGSIDTFEMFVKSTLDGQITHEYSGSIGVTGSGWENDSTIILGSGSQGHFIGQVDEFRLWKDRIAEAQFNNHVRFAESLEGNHVSSSTEDLEFRLSFNNPKNEGIVGSTTFISSSSPVSSYAAFATASGFVTSSDYPYSYWNHVRVNDAKVPNVAGTRFYSDKIRMETQTLTSELNPFTRATEKSFDQSPVDLNKVGIYMSPTDAVNKDILRAFGGKDIINYVADPESMYEDSYNDLDALNRYYWDRFGSVKPTVWEYIRLIRYFDSGLFDNIKTLLPARTHLYSGLMIEPTLLEKNRGYRHKKPSKEEIHYDGGINFTSSVVSTASNDQYESVLDTDTTMSGSGDNLGYTATLVPDITTASGSYPTHTTTLDLAVSQSVTASYDTYTNDVLPVIAYTESVQTDLTQFLIDTIGMDLAFEAATDPYWGVPQTRFGIFAESGSTQMLYLKDGMVRRRRVKLELVTETNSYTIKQLVSGSDQSGPYQDLIVTQSAERLNILDITGSYTAGGTILDGYSYPHHYRYTKDIGTGLMNSFYYGVKNSLVTTIDGGSPVETITSNPNQLRVNKVGRSSEEPILEVEG